MNSTTWIVLVNYNGLEDTRKCLHSLARFSQHAHVVVVDNASKVDPTETLKQEFPWVHRIASHVNGGWAGGNNLGVRHAMQHGADLMILLNNDTIVSEQFLERMELAAEAYPDFGVLGPIIRFMEEPCEIQTMGVVFNRPDRPGFFQTVAIEPELSQPPRVVEVDIVNGCCLAIQREVVERIGEIDEQFFLIHEESDWCLRAQAAGYRCGVIAESLVWHKGSSSFKREGQGFQRYYDARNLVRLLWKHRKRNQGRRCLASLRAYLLYCWHRYCHEQEQGFESSASAILAGMYDGLVGNFGMRREPWRPGLQTFQAILKLFWKRRHTPSFPAPLDTHRLSQ